MWGQALLTDITFNIHLREKKSCNQVFPGLINILPLANFSKLYSKSLEPHNLSLHSYQIEPRAIYDIRLPGPPYSPTVLWTVGCGGVKVCDVT